MDKMMAQDLRVPADSMLLRTHAVYCRYCEEKKHLKSISRKERDQNNVFVSDPTRFTSELHRTHLDQEWEDATYISQTVNEIVDGDA